METVPFQAPSYHEEHFGKKSFPTKVALIDADRYKHVVTYRVFQELDNGKKHSKELLNEIISDYLFKDIFSAFDAKAYVFCFSAPSEQVFRNYIAQEKKYKGNREGKKDDYYYERKFDDMAYVFEYVESRYPTLVFNDLEADDILSMLQDPEDTFIFSHDKDLKQVVGFHYNMTRHMIEYTSPEEGFDMLVRQMLQGDSTDNIPGLHGFGEKALEKFAIKTEKSGDMEKLIMCIKEYTDKKGVLSGMDLFVEMWSLLSMRLSRGKYNQHKYKKGFDLVNSFIKQDNE